MDNIIYSCSEHIEELLDAFLDEVYEMPVMEAVTAKIVCDKCQKQALYQLFGSEVKAKWE